MPRAAVASIAATLPRRVRERVRVDSRSLAVFRASMGLLVIADVVLRARNFGFYYTDDGVVPQWLAEEAAAETALSVFYLTGDPTLIAALFVVQLPIALLLIAGYRTRLATAVTFLLVVSLDHHNPFVLSYADVLFRLLLFWALFLPLGERWSVDAVLRDRAPRPTIASVGSALILGQIVTMYFVNGIHKATAPIWHNGEAAVLVLGLDEMTFLLGDVARQFPTLLQIGGLTWFLMMLGSWLLLALTGWRRLPLVLLFLGGHVSFAITVRIGAFAYVAMAGLVLFVQQPIWDAIARSFASRPAAMRRYRAIESRLSTVASRFPRVPRPTPRRRSIRRAVHTAALVTIVATVLVVATITAVGAVFHQDGTYEERVRGSVENSTVVQTVEDTAAAVGVAQPSWSIFAPDPRTTDRYYVFPAETSDGELVDVYNDRPLTFDRPGDQLQRQYDTYRERFYMSSVRTGEGGGDDIRRLLAEHLCATWDDDAYGELTHVEMWYIGEEVTRDTIDSPEDRELEYAYRFYRHGCGGRDPKTIADPELETTG